MNKHGRSSLDSFLRVQEFLTQHPMADAPTSLGVQATELNDVIQQLSSDAVGQESTNRYVRVHAKSQKTLRQALFGLHMQPISRVAREVFGTTGMDRAFRLPKNSNVSQTLIAAAGAMADAAEKSKDVFVAHGLPDDFVDQLQAAAKAVADAREEKIQNGRQRVTATASVKDQLKRGLKAVRLLNAILLPRIASDAALLTAWKSAKHVSSKAAASPTPAVAPQASQTLVAPQAAVTPATSQATTPSAPVTSSSSAEQPAPTAAVTTAVAATKAA